MLNPWLTVVMTTYNGCDYLPAALESVRAQRDNGIEVVAVDDGSTDDTLAVLESHARRLPLHITRLDHGGNWVANTNRGLTLARGDWVCLLHQDDVWLPHRLATLRAFVARQPRAELLLSPAWYIGPRGDRLGLWRGPLPADSILPARLVVERLLVQNFIALPAPVFRREAALAVGGLREDLWYTADWDFWLKLAAVCPTAYLPAPLVGFRIHPFSQTVRRSNRGEEFRRQLKTVLDKHLDGPGGAAVGRDVRRVARFSAAVNTFLAASVHGNRRDWAKIGLGFLALGPAGWRRFFRDSRIAERVSARLRAGLNGRGVTG